MLKSKLLLFVLILFIAPILVETIAGRKCWKYSRIGGVQVIAGPEQMWAFFQLDQKVSYSCVFCENPERTVGHSQQLLVINKNGVIEKKPIPVQPVVSFHPNFSKVFESEGRVYLFDEFRRRDLVYRWTGQEFEQLSSEESSALLEAVPRDDQGRRDWKQYFRKAEWIQLAAESHILDSDSLKWNDRKYTIEVKPDDRSNENRVSIRCSGDGEQWSEEIARYSLERELISRSELESLKQEWWQETYPND